MTKILWNQPLCGILEEHYNYEKAREGGPSERSEEAEEEEEEEEEEEYSRHIKQASIDTRSSQATLCLLPLAFGWCLIIL